MTETVPEQPRARWMRLQSIARRRVAWKADQRLVRALPNPRLLADWQRLVDQPEELHARDLTMLFLIEDELVRRELGPTLSRLLSDDHAPAGAD